jgi:hypothetical protein
VATSENARTSQPIIRAIIQSKDFDGDGYASGSADGFAWFVIDPRRHPMGVWKRSDGRAAAYARAAQNLNAVVFTNGPMMGKRHGPFWKLERRTALLEFFFWPILAGALAGLVRRVLGNSVGLLSIAVLAGIGLSWNRVFAHWLPCGTVHSTSAHLEDRRNFDNEGCRHVWFGRTGTEFATYAIGDGDLPAGTVEGAGGLIPLVRQFRPVSSEPTNADYHPEFARLHHKRGVAAWGLAPLSDTSGDEDGVIVVAASREASAHEAAMWLSSIGIRDAVATDQRAMIMLGSRREFVIGPPQLHRQAMQDYGLFCR